MKEIIAKEFKKDYNLQLAEWTKDAWHINRESPKKSIELATKALDLSIEIENRRYEAISKFIIGTAQVWISKYELSIKNIHEAKSFFKNANDFLYCSKCAYSLGSCYYYLSNFKESLKCFFESLYLSEKINYVIGQADAYNGIGSVYYEVENYTEALSTLQKSYLLLDEQNADHIKVKVLHGLGEATFHLKDYKQAQKYYEECFTLSNKKGYHQVLIHANEGLTRIYIKKGNIDKAHLHVDLAIETAKKIEFKIGLATNLLLKGELFLEAKDENTALKYFYEAIQVAEEIENIDVRCLFHKTMSTYYEQKGNYKTSISHYKQFHTFKSRLNKQKHGLHLQSLQIKINLERVEKENEIYKVKNKELKYRTDYLKKSNQRIQTIGELGQDIASKLDLEELLNLIYTQINTLMSADVFYIGIHNVKKELIKFPFYIKANKRIHNVEIPMSHTGKFTVWCIRNEKELVLNDIKKEASKYITLMDSQKDDLLPLSVLIVPIKIKGRIMGVIGVHSFEKNSYTKDKVDILKALGAYVSIALENAKIYKRINDLYVLIENKNKEITDSITYAKRIQNAIFPPAKVVKEFLEESFILYKPKDIVAGDFYWLEHKDGKVLFAVADCTGHGVPGAMVSVVCNNALNRSVREYGMIGPGEILTKTREIVVQEFGRSDEDVKDGMDIALCSLEGKTLEYAGAHNPLWVIRKGEILETKADKQPIGQFDNLKPYITHSFELQKADSIYIFSDGYVDQFGGEKGKKFKSRA
ncbi:MAG: tetratricopeptide repeat protein, partial [Flavobacteriales bacterium]|nr:tetratricopeptide repeat protein [Flavobacteriales bacterium]